MLTDPRYPKNDLADRPRLSAELREMWPIEEHYPKNAMVYTPDLDLKYAEQIGSTPFFKYTFRHKKDNFTYYTGYKFWSDQEIKTVLTDNQAIEFEHRLREIGCLSRTFGDKFQKDYPHI